VLTQVLRTRTHMRKGVDMRTHTHMRTPTRLSAVVLVFLTLRTFTVNSLERLLKRDYPTYGAGKT